MDIDTIRAYCEAEIARLTQLETEKTQELMAIRGGRAAYQDMLTELDKGDRDGLDSARNVD